MLGVLIVINLSVLLAGFLNKGVRLTFLSMILLRVIVATLNSVMEQGLPGGTEDAGSFFREAAHRASHMSLDWDISLILNGTHGFLNVHGIWQWALGGPNFFLAHMLSIVGSCLCLFILAKLWLLLSPKDIKGLRWLLIIYTLTPSVITFQSYLLREVWQSLCTLGIIWLGLLVRKQGYSLVRVGGFMAFTTIGITLHDAMIFIIFFTLFAALWLATLAINQPKGFRLSFSRRLASTTLIVLLIGMLASPFAASSDRIEQLKSGELLRAAETYTQRGELGARAEYGSIFRLSQPLTIVPTFLAYQLMPTPGRASSISDTILVFENLFRVTLLMSYLLFRKRLSYLQKSTGDIYLATWFITEAIWAIGTLNWGTAARHHVPAYSLILVIGILAFRQTDRRNETFS